MSSAPPLPPPPRNGGGGEHGNESLWKLVVRLFLDVMNRLLATISRHLLNQDAPLQPRWIDIGEAKPKQTPFEKLCANLLRNDPVTNDVTMMLYYPLQHDHDVVTLGEALRHNTSATMMTSLDFELLFPGYHEDIAKVNAAAAPLLQFFRSSPSLRKLFFFPNNRHVHVDTSSSQDHDALVTLFSQAIAASSSMEEVAFSYNLCAEALGHLMRSSSLQTLDIRAAAPMSNVNTVTNSDLREAIQGNSTLTTLNLKANVASTMGHQILNHIVDTGGCTGLHTLDVYGSYINTQLRYECGVHLASVSSVVSSPTLHIAHLCLQYFRLNVADMTELVDALVANPLTSLKLASCQFIDGVGRELARYMNTPYAVNDDDDDESSNALQDLCIDFGRAAVPATFDANVTAMVHPIVSLESSQDEIGNNDDDDDDDRSPTVTATIGSQLKNLELGGVTPLVNLFGLLRDHALHIRLEEFHPNLIPEDNVQAMVESIPHWVHVQSFGVTIVATQVDERPVVSALRRNGSLRHCNIRYYGDSLVDSKKAKAYLKRNEEVPQCLANLPTAMDGGDPLGKRRQVPSLLVSMLPAEAMVPSTVLLRLSSLGQEAGVIA